MPTRKEVLSALQQVPASNQRLTVADMTLESNRTDERSVVASFKARRPIAVRQGIPTDIHLAVYETFTTDGTGGNTETFSLSQGLVDADAVPEDFVLYETGAGVVQPDSVDYGANSFDYTDDGTANDLHAYYVSDTQARVEIRKSAPRNHQHTLKELDAGLANLREQTRDPLDFDFNHPLTGVIPSDWTLEVVVTAPYSITWDHDSDGSVEATNALLDIPIRRTSQEIPGLDTAVIEAI